MNIGSLLGLKLDFVLETEDVIYVRLGKIIEIGSLIWGYKCIFNDERWIHFYSPLRVNLLSDDELVLFWMKQKYIEGQQLYIHK